MKKIISAAIIMAYIVLQGCSHSEKSNESNKDSISVTSPEVSSRDNPKIVVRDSMPVQVTYEDFDYSNTIIPEYYVDSSWKIFSNASAKDLFILRIPDGNINETEAILLILNSHADTLFQHKFPTTDLISGYSLCTIKDEAAMEAYILNRASIFFKEGFINPKSLLEQPDSDFENYKVCQEAKEKNRMVFAYTLNEESTTYLAYSDSAKKAVPVMYCC